MDGDKITQEYNRCQDSFKKLDQIIPYLLEKIQYNNFRGTIIPATCENTFENICYAQKKGFKRCYFTINIFEHWDEESKQKLELEMKKYLIAFINSFVNNEFCINFTPLTNMIFNIFKQELKMLDATPNIYRCGLGNGYGAINYCGDIYSCQEIVSDYDKNGIYFKTLIC